ncbi:MAG: hypothetical protein HYS34_11525 [Acidobacteria bacterium]|nr:hypothetical protein [Acidobacteriota bacterium]
MRIPLSLLSPLVVILASVVFTPATVAAKASAAVVTVSTVIPFAEHSGVIATVKQECQLQTRLPEFIQSSAKDDPQVVLTADPIEQDKGRVLVLEIVSVVGSGGGAWSGPKSVTVKGELREEGKVIGSFTAARYSGGGAWGGFKGTCSIFGRCVKVLGEDIAGWLKKPTMNAVLGNA